VLLLLLLLLPPRMKLAAIAPSGPPTGLLPPTSRARGADRR
jgi:hypothetical protein